jgi:hypothetical protein
VQPAQQAPRVRLVWLAHVVRPGQPVPRVLEEQLVIAENAALQDQRVAPALRAQQVLPEQPDLPAPRVQRVQVAQLVKPVRRARLV